MHMTSQIRLKGQFAPKTGRNIAGEAAVNLAPKGHGQVAPKEHGQSAQKSCCCSSHSLVFPDIKHCEEERRIR